ncbi:transglycosylase SLT domain-containing protein [Nocardia alni]|uniref:aggregation-promoting factor C-terminal-like domain-containing protein n=1 Tax=Nocardia alni TaxID=2815723 RepID=UPI001C223DA8|nr:transglycosylase SLT domain-containing protein [Nocardia alni]
MAIEIATAYVSILPSTSKLKPAIRDALKDVQSEADRNPVNVRTKVDNKDLIATKKALSDLGSAAGGISTLGAHMAVLGGGAGLAAGAVASLGAGLLAVGGAGALSVATVAVGIHGIADAFKTAAAASDAFSDDAQAKAKAIQSAQNGVTSALRSQESAERSLVDAKRESQDAEQNLTQSRKDALRQLQDLNRETEKGKLDAEGAALSVAEAQRDLNKARMTSTDPLEIAEAQHRLNEALADQQDVLQKNSRTQEDANTANAKGVEGSDKVVAAQERVTKSHESVQTAEEAVTDANSKLVQANQALVQAQTQSSDSAKKAQQAMAKLSPNARDFVTQMLALKPALSGVGNSVQDSLFANWGTDFSNLANTSIPTVREGMDGVAGAINNAGRNAATFFSTAQAQQGIQAAFAGTRDVINASVGGIGNLTNGMLSMSKAAAPAMSNIGTAIGSVFGSIGNTLTQLSNSGQLTTLFQDFAAILSSMAPALSGLVSGLVTLATQAAPGIKALFQALGPALQSIGPPLGSLGAALGTALAGVLPVVTKLVTSLAQGLQPVLPVLGTLLTNLGIALIPLVKPLSEITLSLGTALAQAIPILAPSITRLSNAFASVVQWITPLVPLLGSPVFRTLAVVVGTMVAGFEAYKITLAAASVVQSAFNAVMEANPIGIVALALAGLAAGVVYAYTHFATFRNIVDDFGKFFVGLWNSALHPAVDALGAAFTWLWKNVMVPVWDGVSASVRGAWTDVIQPAWKAMQTGLGVLKDTFSSVVSGIGLIWDGLKQIVTAPINFVIQTVLDDGIFKAWNSVVGFLHLGDGLKAPHLDPVRFATGGFVSGAGGPKDDVIPAMLSNGEFVLNADTVSRIGVANLNRINGGGTADGLARIAGLPALAAGGAVEAAMVNAHEFARSMDGQSYLMGGEAPGPVDCSGFMSAIADVVLGGTGHGRWWATTAFPKSQAGSVNAGGQNWAGGLGKGFSIGVIGGADSGGANGHTAGTLTGYGKFATVNVEAGGSHNNVAYGGPAAGANNSEFPTQYHLPIIDGLFQAATPGSGGSHGSLWNWVIDHTFKPALNGVSSLIHTVPGIGEIPKAMFDKVSGALLDYLKGGASTDTPGAPGTGPVQSQVQQAFARYGWGNGDQWAAASWIIDHESSWNPTAVNPSGAFGLAQFLGSTQQQYLPDKNPNPGIQGDAMARYIRDRYGSPKAAQQFWMAHHWYDQGGIFPNNSIGINQSGKPEAVLTNDQWRLFTDFVGLLGKMVTMPATQVPMSTVTVTPNPGATDSPYTVTPDTTQSPITAADVGTQLQGIGSDFAQANYNEFLGDIGTRPSGGAGQEIMKLFDQRVLAMLAEGAANTRIQAASFIGRR